MRWVYRFRRLRRRGQRAAVRSSPERNWVSIRRIVCNIMSLRSTGTRACSAVRKFPNFPKLCNCAALAFAKLRCVFGCRSFSHSGPVQQHRPKKSPCAFDPAGALFDGGFSKMDTWSRTHTKTSAWRLRNVDADGCGRTPDTPGGVYQTVDDRVHIWDVPGLVIALDTQFCGVENVNGGNLRPQQAFGAPTDSLSGKTC